MLNTYNAIIKKKSTFFILYNVIQQFKSWLSRHLDKTNWFLFTKVIFQSINLSKIDCNNKQLLLDVNWSNKTIWKLASNKATKMFCYSKNYFKKQWQVGKIVRYKTFARFYSCLLWSFYNTNPCASFLVTVKSFLNTLPTFQTLGQAFGFFLRLQKFNGQVVEQFDNPNLFVELNFWKCDQ